MGFPPPCLALGISPSNYQEGDRVKFDAAWDEQRAKMKAWNCGVLTGRWTKSDKKKGLFWNIRNNSDGTVRRSSGHGKNLKLEGGIYTLTFFFEAARIFEASQWIKTHDYPPWSCNPPSRIFAISNLRCTIGTPLLRRPNPPLTLCFCEAAVWRLDNDGMAAMGALNFACQPGLAGATGRINPRFAKNKTQGLQNDLIWFEIIWWLIW